MAALDDVLKGNLLVGVVVGVAATALAPVLLAAGRPLLRSAVKTGILMYERGRESVAELRELVEDAAAEAHDELVRSQEAEAAAAAGMVAASAEAGESASDKMGAPQ